MSKKDKKSKKSDKRSRSNFRGNTILILAPGGAGKSHSMVNLENQEESMYINTDNKPLPIPDKFGFSEYIENPKQVLKLLKKVRGMPQKKQPRYLILDTITHLMRAYVTKHVNTSTNTQQAWQDYLSFYIEVTEMLKLSKCDTVVMGHLVTEMDGDMEVIDRKCPLQGQAGRVGIETDYSLIVEAITVKIKKLKGMESKLLKITDEEKAMGMKRVFITRMDKKHPFTKARLKHNLVPFKQLYMDNDLQKLFDLLEKYD